MLLAGDVGGTKTILALYESGPGGLVSVREQTYPSSEYASLEQIAAEFLGGEKTPEAICIGVAGPVIDGRSRITNLPWLIDEQTLAMATGAAKVRLLNDLQAMSLGLLSLGPEEFVELNPDGIPAPGNKAVLAAGTGLGESILYWDGSNYHALATEGGHEDFAPNDPVEDRLLVYLRAKFGGHVSYERILSGPGLVNLYQFLRDEVKIEESPNLATKLKETAVPAREISESGLREGDLLGRETLRLFARIYGAEAGNLALKCLATGGVLIGGGIAPKILPALADGTFLEGFLAKGRFADFLRHVPVRVALNPNTGLLGAAGFAARCLT
jgi:glucokinase